MYVVYHGPVGLQRIANKVHVIAQIFKSSVENLGYKLSNSTFFDTITLDVSVAGGAQAVHDVAKSARVNLRRIDDQHVGVTFDESVTQVDLEALVTIFASAVKSSGQLVLPSEGSSIPSSLQRTSEYLRHPVFNKHHSETEMLRYMNHLASKDLGLVHSMIPLGSCTMKLNSTSSMIPLTWPEFSAVHPFAPHEQVEGYLSIIKASNISLAGAYGKEAYSQTRN